MNGELTLPAAKHPPTCSITPPPKWDRGENRKGKSKKNTWVKIKTVS